MNTRSIEWVWDCITHRLFNKLKRSCKNGRKDWVITFTNIALIVIEKKILCYNLHSKNNRTINFNLNNDKTCFDTTKDNGQLPSWALDAILYNGDVLVVKRDNDHTIFRYYSCYMKYRHKMGSLTIGSKLKYKTENVHNVWMK